MRVMPQIGTVLLVACFGLSQAEDWQPPKNVLYAQPITSFITSGFSDNAVISLGYERQLNDRGISLFVPLHAGYFDNTGKTDDYNFGGKVRFFSIGSGLGVRKYIGRPFWGSYFTLQSDYLRSWSGEEQYAGYDSLLNRSIYRMVDRDDFLSISQLSFGYKWMWRMFALDLSLGGAFYATEATKQTNLIGAVNLGFPFNGAAFGL